MTARNKQLLDLYTDYLLSSFGGTTATGLARLVPEVSHDQITRFLAQEVLTNKDLWRLVKAQVRQIQSAEAVLITHVTQWTLIEIRKRVAIRDFKLLCV